MRPWIIALGLAIMACSVWAQPDARQKVQSRPGSHKPVSKPETAKKTVKKTEKWTRPTSAKAVSESTLGDEELSIAQRVHHGRLPCELGASVRVEPDQARPGYFNVIGKGFHYRMHPVATSTGAIRLEDKQAGAVWLQLANKSMLMDQKKGQRMADECAHPEQMAFAAEMKNNPPPPLIEVNTGR